MILYTSNIIFVLWRVYVQFYFFFSAHNITNIYYETWKMGAAASINNEGTENTTTNNNTFAPIKGELSVSSMTIPCMVAAAIG